MLSTQFNRDNQYQAITKPSLLAGCIALALLPSAAFAAPATEETVIVEGSATAPDDGENDYSVTSTSAGTKMQMTQRDIPQSVTIVSQQRMEDQQHQQQRHGHERQHQQPEDQRKKSGCGQPISLYVI